MYSRVALFLQELYGSYSLYQTLYLGKVPQKSPVMKVVRSSQKQLVQKRVVDSLSRLRS